MAINYVPNDPLAGAPAMQAKKPRVDRPGTLAGFTYASSPAEDRYNPGTDGFLYWQCREAALAAVETWERLDGPLARWARGRRRLRLKHNAGVDLNAYYNRSSLAFFEYRTGAKVTYTGASTDVVAHEAGHALFDVIRPDVWDSYFTEVNAFHEAFGDIWAILTALDDKRTRRALIAAAPSLWKVNFVEATAEDLADGVRHQYGASHPAGAPRHAFNWFVWQLPSTLPLSRPPTELTREIHSFARVFTGCFYDLVGLLWNDQPSWSEGALWKAAATAGKLLIAGARSAPETPRFFQSVGESMVAADRAQNGGANVSHIVEAFGYHGIQVGTVAATSPTSALDGKAPAINRKAMTAKIGTATRRGLARLFEVEGAAKLGLRAVEVGDSIVAEASLTRDVDLTGLSERLANVVAPARESVRVGAVHAAPAIIGALPQPAAAAEDEVRSFVESLVARGAIDFDGSAGGAGAVEGGKTHRVVKEDGKQVLRRLQFACAPSAWVNSSGGEAVSCDHHHR